MPASRDTGSSQVEPLEDGRGRGRTALLLHHMQGWRTFKSFVRYPTFRWYMLSTTAHGSAMNMQQLVRGYLVFQLTSSFSALGLLALANALPRLGLALIGGLLADRSNKRHVIQAGQAVNFVFSIAVAILLLRDALRFEHLLFAAAIQGIANSFVMPSRSSMIPSLVKRSLFTNAVALNQGSQNVMRLLAPALAGLLVAVMGAALVYLVMAGLYVLAILSLFRVPPLGPEKPPAGTPPRPGNTLQRAWGDVIDGLRYIAGNRPLLLLMGVHMAIGAFVMPYQRMLPGFVETVLGAGAWELGVLMMLTGLGALFGSLLIASIPPHRRGRNLLLSGLLFAVALALFATSRSVWFTMVIVVVIGIGQATRQALNFALVQSNLSDAYRGRVMSVYMMEMGLISLGAYGVGMVAEWVGIQVALGGAALMILLLLSGVYLFVPSYRQLD